MNNVNKFLTAVALIGAAGSASAIQFDLAPVSFTPGSGYSAGGVTDTNKLGVDFTANTWAKQSFDLLSGSSATFTFGTIKLNDGELIKKLTYICGGSALPCFGSNETDNLGVTANFSFSNPVSGSQSSTGTGFAVAGFINPVILVEGSGEVDFTITWEDTLVKFGNGGQFKIVMDEISFDADKQLKDQTYHIEMVTAPIPEPETYALMMAGLGLVGFMARRRKQA
jgi:hypothetical protein